MKARIAWFGWFLEGIAEHPERLRALQEATGLDTLIPESHLYHTSGFSPPPEIVASSPFEGWRTRQELDVYLRYHSAPPVYPVLPGLLAGASDGPLLKLLAEAHSLGMEVWGHMGLWCYGGELFPEYAMRDIEGRPTNERYFRIGAGFCPSKTRLNNWIKACLIDVTKRYDLDGLQLDHARYPHPANFQSLIGCGCTDCANEASRLGYDFDEMKSALMSLKQDLRTLDATRAGAMAQAQFSLLDLLEWTGRPEAIMAWFSFRAELIASKMAELADAVHTAANRAFVIGTDVFPPSIALLGGHIYRLWENNVDFMMGGFGDLVGWGASTRTFLRGLAAALCENIKGFDQPDALRLAYSLLGLSDIEPPASTGPAAPPDDTQDLLMILRRDLAKARMLVTGRVPFYVSLPSLAPQPLLEVIELSKQSGYDGVVLADIEDERTQQVVKRSLRS